jgi:hypothetical protein
MRSALMWLFVISLAVGCGVRKGGEGLDLLGECLSFFSELNDYRERCGGEADDDYSNAMCSVVIEEAETTGCTGELTEYIHCIDALDFATAKCPEGEDKLGDAEDAMVSACDPRWEEFATCSSNASGGRDWCEDTAAGGCDTGVEADPDDDDTFDADYDCDCDYDYDYDYDYDTTFSVTWTGSSIDATVTDRHPDGYYFGLAETGLGYEGWFGEDGISGSVLHELYNSLSLGCVAATDEVIGSSTTLLCDSEATTTYAFFGNENDDYWGSVSFCGGDDCSYYE